MTKGLTIFCAALVTSVACVAIVTLAAPPATKPALVAVSSAAPSPAPSATPPQPLTQQQMNFFETRIRPIFVANCYECHSIEQHKAKGGLVLDSRDGWQKGGKHGPAIVAGEPQKSLLLKAVNQVDPDFEMPPSGDKLSDADIAALTEWVKMGAPDPRVVSTTGKLTGLNDTARKHWSYQPVKNPAVPAVSDPLWVKTPIDAFVLAKLDANHMKPSAPASRVALIRRATYDLIGFPPTPAEINAFLNDNTPNAFEKVVDRLLASPHYGERWGRFWLDTARYSDTTGAEDKKGEYRFPYAWTYRDYVINSFNNNKPYDQFLKEQLAADLLPQSKSDPSCLAALGFITVGKRFMNPNDTIDERIDAVSKGTMAMTVACARCHDHKFDPIPTADYYSLHGVFASTIEPLEKPLIVQESPTNPARVSFERNLAALEKKSRELYYELVSSKSADFRHKAAAYLMVEAFGRKPHDADAVLARNSLIQKFDLDRGIFGAGARSIRTRQSVFGPLIAFARLSNDDFQTDQARQLLQRIAGQTNQFRQLNPLVAKAFAALSPESLHGMQDVADVYGKLFGGIDAQARDYIKACSTATAVDRPARAAALAELMDVPVEIELASALNTDRLTEIAPTLPVQNNQGYAKLALSDINNLLLTDPGAPGRAMVVEDSPKPHNSAILVRGDAQNRGPIVPRQFLEILSGPNRKPFTTGSGRLELAEAIASKDNPRTARVMINRIWMHHFGQGFVRTPDDLGVQSEDPSHPELLDYLATRFKASGWDIKQMHRLIMLSSVYQESSESNAAYAQQDSENRLLWRANLRKLDFEAVRDSMLVFSGELDRTLGGKPVNLTDEPYSHRRSVYGYIDRGKVPELMAQFDFADPDMVNSRRTSTIVPEQALFYMNSPMTINVARKVTRTPEFSRGSTFADRVKYLYMVLLQRAPQQEELEFAKEFLKSAGLQDSDLYDPLRSNPALAKQRERDSRIEQATLERRKENFEAAMRNQKQNPRQTIRNSDGDFVLRRPLTPWEQYAQALLFTNEIAYVN